MTDTAQTSPSASHTSAITGGHTTASLAAAVGGELDGPPDIVICDAAGLELATASSLSFIRSAKFAAEWAESRAGAALVTRGLTVPGHDAARRALITVENADLAMVRVLAMLRRPDHEPAEWNRATGGEGGGRGVATIDPTATLGQRVKVGLNTVIGPRCRIGDGCVIHANVTIGADVTIGPKTMVYPGVVIYDRCTIGAHCILHAGAAIGGDGFGYVPDPQGRGLVKVPHIGTVEIGNGVEVGANSCIDRGKFGPTTIGDGTKIDNLVQIGHNVRIGRACILCGMTGIGGSVTIEDGAVIAGQVGIQDGRRIGTRATICAMSGVMSDVPPGETWFGSPASPHTAQMRASALLRFLSERTREVKALVRGAGKEQGATGGESSARADIKA